MNYKKDSKKRLMAILITLTLLGSIILVIGLDTTYGDDDAVSLLESQEEFYLENNEASESYATADYQIYGDDEVDYVENEGEDTEDTLESIALDQAVSPTEISIEGATAALNANNQRVVYVSVGFRHTLAIRADGTLWAWGDNANGRTGLGTDTGIVTVPTQVGTANNWATVSAGTHHSLAVTTNGELWAWGNNGSGTTGLGVTTGNTLVPTRVGTASTWRSVSAGQWFSLAIRTNGTLWSFGMNGSGRTGRGTDNNTITGKARNELTVAKDCKVYRPRDTFHYRII